MKHVLWEILNQVQDDVWGGMTETWFISVYRLWIVAEPDRVMMQVAGNICELVRKDSLPPASSWLVRDICNKHKGVIVVFVQARVT